MKIGIDIDGVVLDFERLVRTYAELYDVIELNGSGLIAKDENRFQERYNWDETELTRFKNKYFISLSKEAKLMPGVKDVIDLLKRDGHELIVISARGNDYNEMKNVAEEIFKKENLNFDKYYWKQVDKVNVALSEKIDIMIDDSYEICKKMSDVEIETLYFRDKNMKKIDSEYVIDVSNWGEIYRTINKINIKNIQ